MVFLEILQYMDTCITWYYACTIWLRADRFDKVKTLACLHTYTVYQHQCMPIYFNYYLYNFFHSHTAYAYCYTTLWTCYYQLELNPWVTFYNSIFQNVYKISTFHRKFMHANLYICTHFLVVYLTCITCFDNYLTVN